jgi:hypothetical protein
MDMLNDILNGKVEPEPPQKTEEKVKRGRKRTPKTP